MTYVQGGLIEANDYNSMRNLVGEVFGVGNGNYGYGQTPTLPAVSPGDVVQSNEWVQMRNAIETCALHQGTPTSLLPPVADLAVGAPITAHDGITNPYNFPQIITDIRNNRLNYNILSMTAFPNRHVETTGTTWSTSAETTIDFTFPSEDEARYFFNSGGEIRFSGSLTGGTATPGDTAWADILTNIGVVSLRHDVVSHTGSYGTDFSAGYYNCTTTEQVAFTFDTSTASYYSSVYGIRRITIFASVLNVTGTNGGNGDTVRLRVLLEDTDTTAPDVIDGTLELTFGELRATTYLTISTFTPNVIQPLTVV